MSKFIKPKSLILIIVFLSLFLRVWQISTIPPSLTWDEVAWAYNAYSIGIDGRDEFGVFLPFSYLESFGDFKPPLYAYLAVLPIKLLGLTEFAVRLPSAVFGALTVLITYFLVQQIFCTSKRRNLYALFTSLLLALSPWHIMMSRGAWEANIVTFLLSLGVLLFLLWVNRKEEKKRIWLLIASAIVFTLAPYTFNTGRVVMPLLVMALTLGFYKTAWQRKSEVVLSAIVGIIILAPSVPHLLSPQARLRFAEVNIFSDISVIERTNQEFLNTNNEVFARIVNNRRIAYSLEFFKHYFDNLNPIFLFISGDDNPKFSVQEVGHMYLFELPFFVMGAFLLFRKKEGYWWVVPVWLMLGIIPAATANDTPHALRVEASLPTFQIISAVGLVFFWQYLATKRHSKVLQAFTMVIMSINFYYFVHIYFTHYAKHHSELWQYGYKEVYAYTESVKEKYSEIQMTNKLGRAYIYYLYHTQTPPNQFRKDAVITKDQFGFVHVDRYNKYTFREMIYPSNEGKTLYIDVAQHVPKNATILREFIALNGNTVLAAYEY